MTTARLAPPKHQQVFDALQRRILAGRFKEGDRLPSEAELVTQFGASRITVGRAVRDLQLAGLVERRAGSGTYVKPTARAAPGLLFGLLIPDLGETEIFEPICDGMTSAPHARDHALIRGGAGGSGAQREARAWSVCQQYMQRRVSGVFFAPLELTPNRHEVNRRIVSALGEAGIPIVLLDRPVVPFPQRGAHDLVGIDNRRAGYIVTHHLIEAGAQRIAFVGLPDAASTVDARQAGYRAALDDHGVGGAERRVARIDPADADAVRALVHGHAPDGVVCANDRTAAVLMQTLLALGVPVPDAVRLVGIDDVEYARLLPVPLTTLRQPCQEIGEAAMAAMLQRVATPDLPPRDIFLHATLVVRRSCGGAAPAD